MANDKKFVVKNGLTTQNVSFVDNITNPTTTQTITLTNVGNWNDAYGWGDHATAGYLTSYTETDPVFSAAPAAGITATNITNWNDAYGWGDHSTQGYLTSETNTSLSLATNILSYTDETGTTTQLDLSLYLDDTNLARLVSGSLDGATGIATFTRDDATTFTVDFSPFFDDTNLARITSASFGTGDGVLTLTRDDASTVTVDLDGRYLEDAPSDGSQYARQDGAWAVVVGGSSGIVDIVDDTTPQLGGDLDLNNNNITGTGNISLTGTLTAKSSIDMVSPDGTNTMSIDMIDSDIITFSGDSGELFSIADSLTGTIFSVSDITGIPSIEVDADATVRFAEIDGNVLIGTPLDDGVNKLQVAGSIGVTVEVNAAQVQLSGGTGDQGTLTWDTDEETLALNEGVHTLRLGQESLYHVRNNSGSSIAIGTPVMATGTLGNSGRITIAPMDGTNPANAKYYLGVTSETIANDADGKVTHFGKVRGVNLSTYQEGDVLWLSTASVGAFTATEPTIGIKVPTAFVISNNSNGTMFVRATNSIGLADLDDVSIGSPVLGEILYYDGTKFRNGTTVEAGLLTASDLDSASNVEDVFSTNGSAVNFLLSEAPTSKENILVTVDGVVQPTSSYTLSNLTLTISPAIPSGSEVRVLHLKPLLAEAVKAKHTTETAITLTSANMNSSMTVTGDVTVNENVGTAGDTVLIYNNSSLDVTVTQGTGVTLRLAGTETTGTRTLAGRGLATLFFVSTTEATLGGSGVS